MAAPLPNTRRKVLTTPEATSIYHQIESELPNAIKVLEEATQLASKAGFSIASDLVVSSSHNIPVAVSTGGHSNTDHVVVQSGDFVTDRIAELKRNLLRRRKECQPESKGEDRWDKSKIPGQRRRRIRRDADLPSAPPEPPPSGYVVFVGQMTTKIRHDRPNEHHNQTRAIKEISSMWNSKLTDEERQYYNDFALEAGKEYRKQQMEYRATGHYTRSDVFEKVEGASVWVRKNWAEKNDLERELAGYKQYTFPPRPEHLEEEYKRREEESKRKRKMKMKAETKGKKKPPPASSGTETETEPQEAEV